MQQVQFTIGKNRFGWWGMVGLNKRVARLVFGEKTPAILKAHLFAPHVMFEKALEKYDLDLRALSKLKSTAWLPELAQALDQFATGEYVDFNQFPLFEYPQCTLFTKRVQIATREIPWGETSSYLQIAEVAGSPRAARAVGRVMATNLVPLLIPCHRVCGSAGKLGGYSASDGLNMKLHLLQLEKQIIS